MFPTLCPFNETSRTFREGEMSFLGESNPNSLISSTPWTGRLQFIIESVHEKLSNIIDSFLINLDDLQLGADFTQEMLYTGYHNISQMSMSFRVECSPNYYGPDCVMFCEDKAVYCRNTGEIVCTNVGEDPSNDCITCLPLFNMSLNCTTCRQSGYDPEENCTQCLPNRDPVMNCTSCLPGYSGENCVSESDANVGGAVGGLLVVTLVVTILVVAIIVVLIVIRQKMTKSKNTAQISAGDQQEQRPNNNSENTLSNQQLPTQSMPVFGDFEQYNPEVIEASSVQHTQVISGVPVHVELHPNVSYFQTSSSGVSHSGDDIIYKNEFETSLDTGCSDHIHDDCN